MLPPRNPTRRWQVRATLPRCGSGPARAVKCRLDPTMTAPRPSTAHLPTAKERRSGLVFGFVGVASFSLTLPATRLAVASLDPVFVGLGRAVVAAVLAAVVLVVYRAPWPGWALVPRLALVAGGVVVGFPLFSAWAMQHVPGGARRRRDRAPAARDRDRRRVDRARAPVARFLAGRDARQRRRRGLRAVARRRRTAARRRPAGARGRGGGHRLCGRRPPRPHARRAGR